MSDATGPASSKPAVDIQIRRYPGVLECDVVVATRGREMTVTCPDYERAVRWAEMECKSYRVKPQITNVPAGSRAA